MQVTKGEGNDIIFEKEEEQGPRSGRVRPALSLDPLLTRTSNIPRLLSPPSTLLRVPNKVCSRTSFRPD